MLKSKVNKMGLDLKFFFVNMTKDVNKDPNPNPYFLYGFGFGSGKNTGPIRIRLRHTAFE